MTPADVAALADATPMPPGYVLKVQPQRNHKYRSVWNVRILDEAGNRLWGRAYYNAAVGIVVAQANAWAMSRKPVA